MPPRTRTCRIAAVAQAHTHAQPGIFHRDWWSQMITGPFVSLRYVRQAERRIWHSLLAAAARPASAHIAHVLCALNRRRIRCRQSEGWLRHYRRPTRPGIRAGCSSLAALAGHRLMVTADPRPLVGSHPRGHRTQVLTVFRLPAAQFVKAPDLLGLGEQEPVIIYRNRVVTLPPRQGRPAASGIPGRRLGS